MSQFVKPVVNQSADTATSDNPSIANTLRPSSLAGGAKTQLVASTAEDWAGFWVYIRFGSRQVIHVYTGGTGSEVRIATFPAWGWKTYAGGGGTLYVPIPVPAGTRISAGVDESNGSDGDIELGISGDPAANHATLPPFTRMDCGPFDLENDGATWGLPPVVDPGGTANTLGTWTEISHTTGNGPNNILNGDSIGEDYKYIAVKDCTWNTGIGGGQNSLFSAAYGSTTPSSANIYELIGAASSASEDSHASTIMWVPWGRPAGDKIWAQVQSDDIDAGDRVMHFLIFGLL